MDNVVSFFTTFDETRVNVGLFVLTLRSKDDDSTLVSLSAVEYLCWDVGDLHKWRHEACTISCILSFTNCSAHCRLVISVVRSSPFESGGRSTVLSLLIDGEVSMRNIVTVYYICDIRIESKVEQQKKDIHLHVQLAWWTDLADAT